MKKPRLVDLSTYDEELFNLVSERFGEGHIDCSEKESVLFCFCDLNYKNLLEFLKDKDYEYEIRDSKTGNYVEIKKLINHSFN